MDQIKLELEKLEVKVLGANTLDDGRVTYFSRPDIGCVLLDWDLCEKTDKSRREIEHLSQQAKERNFQLPLYLLTSRLGVEDIPLSVDSLVHGYIWPAKTPRTSSPDASWRRWSTTPTV